MLRLETITFAYNNGTTVLKNINLAIPKGSHVALVGESGCGKSTLLKIIYGLMDLEQGNVFWDDEPVLGPAYHLIPGAPFMKYLAQDYDLMPFITVAENIAQYLSVFYPEELQARTQYLLEATQLTPFANKKVKTLSGGQQQRVALARVLAQKPEVLLLDEPFGHIDNFLKNQLRRTIFEYTKRNNITCITATHDHNDVLPFMDRMIVLKDSEVIADASPMALYNTPKTLYLASLFGEANRVALTDLDLSTNSSKSIIIYAHELSVSPQGIPLRVLATYPMGDYYLFKGVSNKNKILFFIHKTELLVGAEIQVNTSPDVIAARG